MNLETVPTPGISGKKFTIAMVGTMIVVGGSLAYILAVYEQLDGARAKSAEHWRTVATQLDQNYKQIENLESAVLLQQPDWHSRFRSQADQFRTVTNLEQQMLVGRELEVHLQGNPEILAVLPAMPVELRQEITELNASLSAERDIQQSLTGRIVQFFIRHPIRQNWDLIRSE